MKPVVCKNCGFSVDKNFCGHCGQHASAGRFTFSSFFSKGINKEIPHETGFFQSILLLTTSPGEVIRDFLAGRRSRLYSPLKLLLITGMVATFLSSRYMIFITTYNTVQMVLPVPDFQGYYYFSNKYYSITNLTGTLIFAFFSWIVFYKMKYNFVENLIMNCYITSYQFVVIILVAPVIIMLPDHKLVLLQIFFGVTLIYSVYVYVSFFQGKWYYGISGALLVTGLAFVPSYYMNYFLYSITPVWLLDFLDTIIN